MRPSVVAVIVIIVVVAIYFLAKGNFVSNPATSTVSQSQGTQNDADLTSASNDLDNTDLNSIDSELNQNQADASSF